MTVQQMLNSLPVLQKMAQLKLPIKKAHKIYSLAKVINEQREFFINEEKKLIEKFNATILDDGKIKFENNEDFQSFSKEHAELVQFEIQDLNCIELSLEDLDSIEFTAQDLMSLEGVINFVE